MTDSEISNRAGERIDHAFHPGDRTDALVIIGHGVTAHKDWPILIRLAKGLSELGWPCLRITFSGNGESEGRFEDSCITKQIGDLQAVLDAVPDDVKIAYLGYSMGGAVGVLTAARDMRIRALISLAGLTHTASFAAREFAEVQPGEGLMWGDPKCPLTQNFIDDFNAIGSTLSAVEAITQPWLLIHGEGDDVVPVKDSMDAYEAAQCEKRLVPIPEGNHLFTLTDHPQIIEAIDDWLRKAFD